LDYKKIIQNLMKKTIMMVVAAVMATVSANAQFEKGTWSLQPFVGGVISSVTNVEPLDMAMDRN
jgi:hypothetical protein